MRSIRVALLLLATFQISQGQRPEETVLEIIQSTTELSEFARVLELDGLHQAFLDRQVTLFAPTNEALRRFPGRHTENLILNHMTNIALLADQFPEKLASLVTGNPPLWVTRDRGGIFVNEARVVRENIRARSSRGDEQLLHIIDDVLEPLVPTSSRDAQFFVGLNAQKLLTKSTLYDLGGKTCRAFLEQAEYSRKTHMFGVPGQHTFFLPIDDAFETTVVTSGYDYDRNKLKGQTNRGGGPKIRKELIDQRVLEAHIVPHRMLFTSHAPTPEFPSVAWLKDGIQVNVSLQPSFFTLNDPRVLTQTDLSGQGDRDQIGGQADKDYEEGVAVRSNTIVGDRAHSRGMVVARIVKGNIPVTNGVVHLIDKPLMVVAKTLHEYIMEEGRQPGNRLSKFATLLRDKGGLFAEALLEAKDGTVFAPSNTALENVDMERLDFLLGSDYLRAEMLGLHFVRDRIVSTDYKIREGGDKTFSTPASLAQNRVWLHYSPKEQEMTVMGRGVNASVVEKDIGTINGVIHVIDRVLGVPYQTCGELINSDPNMSHMASMLRQFRMEELFTENPRHSDRRFTMVVPSNAAWERARTSFSKAYNTILDGQFPNYGKVILERHFSMGRQPLTFEELIEMSRKNPRRIVPFITADLTFTELGEFELNAYKDNFVAWKEVKSKVIMPNMECTNGIIHLVDTVFLDDAPPWEVGAAVVNTLSVFPFVISVAFVTIFGAWH